MNGNIRIGTLFGIPFYVNFSWFLVLALVTLEFGRELAVVSSLGGLLPLILGFIAALLLFASVLAHELGHSLVAIRQGIEVKSITLFIFGGLAMLDKESETPGQSFWVAIAGPAVSLVLFGIFLFVGVNVPLPSAIGLIVALLAQINLILAMFNLLPGLPLDGGNILKAAVWKITGNPNKGVLFASRVGQVFGWLAIAIGALAVLNLSPYGSFWTLFIGLFLLQNAGFSAQTAIVQDKLDGLTAEDAVIPNSPVVSGDLTLREFVNDYVIGQPQWRKFLVTDEAGQLAGTISPDDLKEIATSLWTETRVRELAKPIEEATTVRADRSLLDAVKLIESKQLQQLPVIGEDGAVLGLLEKSSIRRLLEKENGEIQKAMQ
ncbi:MAG: site-2 protease family protein [Cyanobacteriota bacterium]|nr:site-2 protease family protein [Cyanobacteriota bacterium]